MNVIFFTQQEEPDAVGDDDPRPELVELGPLVQDEGDEGLQAAADGAHGQVDQHEEEQERPGEGGEEGGKSRPGFRTDLVQK